MGINNGNISYNAVIALPHSEYTRVYTLQYIGVTHYLWGSVPGTLSPTPPVTVKARNKGKSFSAAFSGSHDN